MSTKDYRPNSASFDDPDYSGTNNENGSEAKSKDKFLSKLFTGNHHEKTDSDPAVSFANILSNNQYKIEEGVSMGVGNKPDFEVKPINNTYGQVKTVISPGVAINGNIDLDDSAEIHGKIKGDINCKGTILLSETSNVEGNITASSLNVNAGNISGNIDCKESIVVTERSIIAGNITANVAHVSGEVTGNLSVNGKLTLGATSIVLGDVVAAGIEIAYGAIIKGHLSIAQK